MITVLVVSSFTLDKNFRKLALCLILERMAVMRLIFAVLTPSLVGTGKTGDGASAAAGQDIRGWLLVAVRYLGSPKTVRLKVP